MSEYSTTVCRASADTHEMHRFSLELGEIRFDCHDPAARDAASAAFTARVSEQARAVLGASIHSPKGQRDAYRPNERILPSNFANKASWERYLDALRQRRPAILADILPDLTGVALVLDSAPDFVDPSRSTCAPLSKMALRSPRDRCSPTLNRACFKLVSSSPCLALHQPLRLDRVQPSYRFKDWLTYPAMGLNCGVQALPSAEGIVRIGTTWAPRYANRGLMRRSSKAYPQATRNLPILAATRTTMLLPNRYDAWIASQALVDAGQNLSPEIAERERQAHAQDLEAYRRESNYIRSGIQLLLNSRAVALTLASRGSLGSWAGLDARAAPWEAWLLTNEAFALYGRERFTDWRLFQLGFIFAHILTFASRMPEFADQFDADRDEYRLACSILRLAAASQKLSLGCSSLTFFSTGSGVSSAA